MYKQPGRWLKRDEKVCTTNMYNQKPSRCWLQIKLKVTMYKKKQMWNENEEKSNKLLVTDC